MIIPDANLILYAHNQADPDHAASIQWWERLLNGAEPVGIPHAVIMAFLRLSTSARILLQPLTVDESARCIESWFKRPQVRLIEPSHTHLSTFLQLIRKTGVAGNLTTDAHIAVLSLEYHAEIHSADADFARFPGIRWRNPLSS
ncbi:MAG: type II toxin-antitoxin system VapC family toxin [Blastochloris sp.]|nr:type II toxin-antitoxin system VapC family toxin [Blastochloris sp.]